MENQTAPPSWHEVLSERGKQVNNLARRVAQLEDENLHIKLALRELAAYVSEEAWRAVLAELDAAARNG